MSIRHSVWIYCFLNRPLNRHLLISFRLGNRRTGKRIAILRKDPGLREHPGLRNDPGPKRQASLEYPSLKNRPNRPKTKNKPRAEGRCQK
jgi:hypothetical protein